MVPMLTWGLVLLYICFAIVMILLIN